MTLDVEWALSRSPVLLVNSLARSKSECLNFNALGGGRRGMSQTCRLAAILAADVAGYSRLMGADEEGTLERLKALHEVSLGLRINDATLVLGGLITSYMTS
jgi:class 3 adenylate cyclase